MNLKQFMRPECVSLGFKARDKEAVLRHVASLVARRPACAASEAEVYEILQAREAAGTTGLERGVAIPHARLEGMQDFVVGLVVVRRAVDFGAADGEAARIVAFVLGPPQRPDDHLRVLATVSRALSSPVVREGLLAVKDPEEALGLLGRRVPPTDEDDAECEERSLIVVVVQVEAAFLPLMQAVSAETACASVVEASGELEMLHVLPLYSRLWGRDLEAFHRMIFAAVRREVAGSLLAEIRQIASQYAPEGGVLATVQELSACFGRLGAAQA